MDNGLPNYVVTDVRAATSLNVNHNRGLSADGTLIHTTSGLDSLDWLTGGSERDGNPASADFLIARNGRRYQITPEGRFAYHAGKSRLTLDRVYTGDEVSQKLIGIELECLDSENPTYAQLDSLAQCIVGLAGIWGWRWPFLILGHYAVARPLGRRSDPVNMDWGSLMGRLYIRAKNAAVPGLIL